MLTNSETRGGVQKTTRGLNVFIDMLVVGPHLDDNVLTWGLTMLRAARLKRVASLTIFGGEPEHLTAAGRERNERLGMVGVSDRQQEDIQASAVLSPDIEVVHWPYHAATLRWEEGQPRVIYSQDKYGPLTVGDGALVDEIVERLKDVIMRRRPKVILGLSGVAPHVDHQITAIATQRAVKELATEHGLNNVPALLLGADLPYAIGKDIDDRVTTLYGESGMRQIVVEYEEAYDRKLDAVSRFVTQVPEFDKYLGDWRESFRGHARRFGSGESQYGEPCWEVMLGNRQFDINDLLSGIVRPHVL